MVKNMVYDNVIVNRKRIVGATAICPVCGKVNEIALIKKAVIFVTLCAHLCGATNAGNFIFVIPEKGEKKSTTTRQSK